MIAAWMLTAVVFAAFVALAAWCAERAMRVAGGATRLPWVAAITAGAAWPVVAPLLALLPPKLAARATLPVLRVVPDVTRSIAHRGIDARLADRALLVLWALATTYLLLRAVRAWFATRRLCRAAERRRIDGVALLVSDGAGPAVVGVARPEILFPRGLLTLEPALREIVVRHEEEHRLARDSWIALGCVVARVLFPWSPALWWMTRRVRLAVEIDCDRRMLRGGVSASRYGKLLLLVAQSSPVDALSPALVSSRSHLDRRITAMLATHPSHRRLRIAASLAGMALAGLAACSSHIADVGAAAQTSGSPRAVSPENTFFEFQIEKPAQMIPGSYAVHYPDALRAESVAGEVLAQFVVDETGAVVPGTFKVLKATRPEFVAAVREAIAPSRWLPAEVGGRKVKQLVQQPFTFTPAAAEPAAGTPVRPNP